MRKGALGMERGMGGRCGAVALLPSSGDVFVCWWSHAVPEGGLGSAVLVLAYMAPRWGPWGSPWVSLGCWPTLGSWGIPVGQPGMLPCTRVPEVPVG